MNRIANACASTVVVGLLACGANNVAEAALFSDTFENGTAGNNIGSPWGANNITPATYQSTGNPFASGAIYGDINDPGPGTSPSQAVRLMSHGNNDGSLVSSINGQLTTYSFDFWEPSRTGDVNSVVFGYYHTGTNVDLNTAGRNYSSTLHDGLLSPQAVVSGSGSATSYSLETVNTVFMIANDTASAVANYAGTTRTVAATTADVWISKDGAAPVFAFSLQRQNASTTLAGVGFRTNNADIERVFVDNVLLVNGASFDRSEVISIPEPTALAFFALGGILTAAAWKCKWLS
jgi:hypothetical protein